jgi:cell wall-associated NlpC family hydrolase
MPDRSTSMKRRTGLMVMATTLAGFPGGLALASVGDETAPIEGQIGAPKPRRGHAYFSVTLPLGEVTGVTAVRFRGGDAIAFHEDKLDKTVTAIAPPGVRSGPVKVRTALATYVSEGKFVVVEGADPRIDFAHRNTLPQSAVAPEDWCDSADSNGGWGPPRAIYPAAPASPADVDERRWKQARLIAAALQYEGLPYNHHHIPAFDGTRCAKPWAPRGLDCSNFTSWILDYAFGHQVTSAIQAQAADSAAGPLVPQDEALQPGDLLFIRGSPADGPITHVAIYLDATHRIDSTISGDLDGVHIRSWGRVGWWPYNSFSHARRPLDLVK